MGWNGQLDAASEVGSAAVFTPDTEAVHKYTVTAFSAPKEGIYRFEVKGSGGHVARNGSYGKGGKGGLTVGYLHMQEGETVYLGAGGLCSAAFVSKAEGAALGNIGAESLYFVAGAGGGGGAAWDNGYSNQGSGGGNGGGLSGARGGGGSYSGAGGTQTSGGYGNQGYSSGSYGRGGAGGYENHNDTSCHRGHGGDGYYGGGAGCGGQGYGHGGGGGSGYLHAASLRVSGKTYANSTTQGGGAESEALGSVVVIYYARASLPVMVDGVTVDQILFNGTVVEHLIYNGLPLFAHTIKGRIAALAKWAGALRPKESGLEEAYA